MDIVLRDEDVVLREVDVGLGEVDICKKLSKKALLSSTTIASTYNINNNNKLLKMYSHY